MNICTKCHRPFRPEGAQDARATICSTCFEGIGNFSKKVQHKPYVELSDMEKLANRLALYIQDSQEVQVMFHNFKGSGDFVASVEDMIVHALKLEKKAE